MATVIKALGPIRTSNGMSFNFDDMTDRANAQLDQVRARAAELIAQAQQEADALRRQAEADGKQAALRAAEKTMEEKIGKHLATLLPAIQRTTAELEKARQAWLAHWEQTAIQLAVRIAERVIRRELAAQPQITVELVREALEMATGSDEISIRMNPADVAALGKHVETLLREVGGRAKASVIPDAAITAGGCRVETRFGVLDQQVGAQLQRIEEELT